MYKVENVNVGGPGGSLGGQKRQKLVNVVSERPLILLALAPLQYYNKMVYKRCHFFQNLVDTNRPNRPHMFRRDC
jgi:hypothetical protein